jgi:hypothetical protein
MHRLCSIFTSLLLFTAPLSAQESIPVPWANKLFVVKEPPAVIGHDFGSVPNGTIVTQRFPIQNIWAVPITIHDVRVQCGCVTATMPKKTLDPNESSYMELTMDLRKFPSQNKAVTVWVDLRQGEQYRSTAVMQVRALTLGDLSLTPGSLDFGVVPQGQKLSKTVDIQYSGNLPNWQITGALKNENASVSVQVQALPKQRGLQGYRITATLKEDAPPGSLQEQVILSTNDTSNPNITISVTGTIQAPYSYAPNPLRFDGVRVGETKQINVTVSGAKPFKIIRVAEPVDGITVQATNPRENKVQVVQIRFQPTQAMEGKKQIILITETGAPIPVTLDLNAINP